jgi:hypothetical protein
MPLWEHGTDNVGCVLLIQDRKAILEFLRARVPTDFELSLPTAPYGSVLDTQVTILWCGAAQNLCLHFWWLPAPRKHLHRNLHAHARKLVCMCSPADSMRLFHGTFLVCMALTVNGERCLPGSG